MDKSVGNNIEIGNIREADSKALRNEIDKLMNLMLVEGELSNNSKAWVRRTLIRLVYALDPKGEL